MRRSALNLMLSALLAGCGGSGESLNSIPEEPPEPDAPQLLGRVTDLQGNPLDGVRVDFDGRSTESLANGRFMFSDAAGDPRPLVATAPGWSRAWRTVAAISDASQELELRLAPARSVQLPDAALGGVIDGDDGVQIELPAAPLVRSDGTAASGPFTVQWALMNSRPGLRASPGGLWAQDALGERALLESFGMVDVQLWQGDEPLQLRGDEPARLRFPLAATAEYEDGASAPLWHFDEELGLWSQQGWGEVHGGVFEAQVPHFSTWNCDDTFETTCITGRLVDDAGQGVPEVIIRSVGVDYLGTDLVWSFGSGEFVVYARAASEVEVSAVQIVDGSYRDILRTTVSTPGSAGAPCLELPTTVITPPDVDNDGDGFDEDEGDCDDVDPARYPGAMVLCSRIDMDCDGVEDSGVDADGDGWGSCLDCDDSDPRRHPQALEICDGVDDNDCEGDPDPTRARRRRGRQLVVRRRLRRHRSHRRGPVLRGRRSRGGRLRLRPAYRRLGVLRRRRGADPARRRPLPVPGRGRAPRLRRGSAGRHRLLDSRRAGPAAAHRGVRRVVGWRHRRLRRHDRGRRALLGPHRSAAAARRRRRGGRARRRRLCSADRRADHLLGHSRVHHGHLPRRRGERRGGLRALQLHG